MHLDLLEDPEDDKAVRLRNQLRSARERRDRQTKTDRDRQTDRQTDRPHS